jgi:glycerol kinase
MVETTALGAAGLAGIALGVWRSPDDLLAGRRFARFEPTMGPDERIRRRAEWDRALEAALAWARGRERILKV